MSPIGRVRPGPVPDDVEVILAYETVWAIGASKLADADQVVNVTNELKRMIMCVEVQGLTPLPRLQQVLMACFWGNLPTTFKT